MAQDSRVDADQLTAVIHQRSARVTGVDGSVGLNKVLVFLNSKVPAARGTHDSHGYRLSEAERIAHGEDVVTHLKPVGVPDNNGLQIRRVDLQNGNVG